MPLPSYARRPAMPPGASAGVQLSLPVPPAPPDDTAACELTACAEVALRRGLDFALDRADEMATGAHLLLGIISQPRASATLILDEHEVGATRLSARVMALLPPPRAGARLRRRPDVSAELELSLRMAVAEAGAADSSAVTTAHLLLGLLDDGSSPVGRLLEHLGISGRAVRLASRRHRERA